jgi:hypothetical protein
VHSSSEAFDNRLRIRIYELFVEHGRPPTPVETALALDATSSEVESGLRRLHDAHVIVLAPGTPYIWMANPLCALPSPFAVRARGRDWYGICIWDALGIVAMLGGDGRVSTRCPDCGVEMTLEVHGGEIERKDYIVHYVVPARHWWDDIGFN